MLQGADMHAVDYDDRSALHVAAHSGCASAVRYLLTVGLSVHNWCVIRAVRRSYSLQ